MSNRALLWTALCLAALAALAGGCGPPPIDPGPNPVRVVLVINQTLSGQQVGQALQDSWGPFPGSWTRWDSFMGPFWEVEAEQRQPDGSWRPLPLAPGQPEDLAGYRLKLRRVFLTTPGPQELRFKLVAGIQRSWQERLYGPRYLRRVTKEGTYLEELPPQWYTRVENIELLRVEASQKVEPKHGQELVLEPFK
ncbi:MAG: hypothetical protein C4525_16100 [Desulfarculus sp.]|nr:MAG: hypothetical protein C4525_16100 [Desulfarculus sp.]